MKEPPSTGGRTGHWLHEARATLVVTPALALLAGGLFPALVLGLGQLLFSDKADGGLIHDAQGRVVGSRLVGQQFTSPRYFHGRPSAAGGGYDGAASRGLNLGPTNEQLLDTLVERARLYRQENNLSDDVELPADAVTTSASGLDPHISPANAYLQVDRVARARGLSPDGVRQLVDRHTDDHTLRFFGEPRVNVLELNLVLDEMAP
jgi:K+-transporting ATPase ATPase C chain